jgi:hypothetical protein
VGLDMGVLVKLPQLDLFGRPISITPNGGAAYVARGIWHRDNDDFLAEDNSVVTDHKVSVDVLDAEFAVLPRQGDVITIPADGTVPAEGTFTILSAHRDGGGMTNLLLEEYYTVGPATPFTGDPSQLRPVKRERGRYDYG